MLIRASKNDRLTNNNDSPHVRVFLQPRWVSGSMRIFLILASTLFITGCERTIIDVMDWLSGHERLSVVISDAPVTLTENPISFVTPSGTEVVGKRAALCVPLRGNFPIQGREEMDREYDRLLGGARLAARLTTNDGRTVDLRGAGQSWSKYGVLFERDELSACISVNCSKEGLDPETLIVQVEISASAPTTVRGIYWESTNVFDFAD